MTIDERLEAIAQSLELLASFQRDTEERQRATDARLEKLLSITETLVPTMNTISHLVLQHEQRIQRLEGQQ